MESSRGSLRFDEFPTSMKRRNPFGSRATRLLAYENARPSESRLPALKKAGTQGLRRPRFPFFQSQCQRAGGRAAVSHTPEPPMEANPPSGVNDSRSVSRDEPRSCSASVRGSRGRVSSRRKWEQPARRIHLSRAPSLVKGSVTVRGPCRFSF